MTMDEQELSGKMRAIENDPSLADHEKLAALKELKKEAKKSSKED